MKFQQILLVLRARWRIACCVLVGIVTVAVLFSVLWPKQYTATASVVVDAKPDPVTGTNGMAEMALEAYVTTQADVISSVRVAQRVVKVLKLDQVPEFQEKWRKKTNGVGDISIWLADYLVTKKLAVKPGHESVAHPTNVIDIAVKWSDAKIAADLANAFAQVAIDTNIELKVEPAKQYSAWFVQRSRDLHKDLEVKQKRLSDFQRETGIIATDEKVDVENDRLNQLSTALVAIQGQRQDSQSRQRQVSSGSGSNDSLPEVLQSPLIATLKNSLSDAEAKQADVAGRLGKNHPDYQAAVAEVASLKDRIALETAKIAASLDSTTHVNLRREADLREAVELQKKRVLELKHLHDQSAVLENDVIAVQHDLDTVNQRLAQSSLEGQTQQTNVVLLTSASPPVDPSFPKLLLNLALGLFLGISLGIGVALLLEVRDPLIRREEELLELLGVPLLVKIGPIKIPPMGGRVSDVSPARAKPTPTRLDPAAI
jgi:chain length determinant protein EpsF